MENIFKLGILGESLISVFSFLFYLFIRHPYFLFPLLISTVGVLFNYSLGKKREKKKRLPKR